MALTGWRLTGPEALAAGLATHLAPWVGLGVQGLGFSGFLCLKFPGRARLSSLKNVQQRV